MNEARKARALEADAAITKLLNDYADVFGPINCAIHGQDRDACECDPDGDTAVPVPSLMNAGWILASTWTSMDDGEGYFDWESNQGSQFTSNLGLIRAVTLDMESELNFR